MLAVRGRRHSVTELTLALTHSAEQWRGWPPPGSWRTAPGRDSQACQSSGAALWRQSIKCPYTRAGAGARGGVGKARVDALEQSGPRPRGCSALERGGPRPRERLSLERGGLNSRGIRCVVLAGRGGHQGRGCVVYVLWVHELIRVLRFFCRF
jgi:hypothetical protein